MFVQYVANLLDDNHYNAQKNLFHHIICMQMSEDDLAVQLGIRSLRIGDMGAKHAFYANEIASPKPQRFRPYFDENL